MDHILSATPVVRKLEKNESTPCHVYLEDQDKCKVGTSNWETPVKPCPSCDSMKLKNKEIKTVIKTNASTQCYFKRSENEDQPKGLVSAPLSKKKTLNKFTQCCNNEFQCKIQEHITIRTRNKYSQTDLTQQDNNQSVGGVKNRFLSLALKFFDAKHFADLEIKVMRDHNKHPFIRITKNYSVGLLGLSLDPLTIILNRDGSLILSVLFRSEEVYQIYENDMLNECLFNSILTKVSGIGNYVFCPGINSKNVSEDMKNYQLPVPPSLLILNHPFKRYQSKLCQVYYERPPDNQVKSKVFKLKQCKDCHYTSTSISNSQKRKLIETPTRKFKRQRISSNYGISRLSPASRQIRLSRLRSARKCLQGKIARLEKNLNRFEVTLNNDHSKQMETITQIINDQFSDVLEETVNDKNLSEPTRKALRDSWEMDSKLRQLQDKKQFLNDQIKNKSGKKSNKWSTITLRLALAIYSRSKAAYNALQSFDILQLPCERTLQEKAKKYHHKPGIDQVYLADQERKYKEFQMEKVSRGDQKPLGEGVLVFDEVKVIEKIIWNSKSNEFTGFAMSREEYKDLNDIIIKPNEDVEADSPAQYVLQFLWRDISSEFDFIGPYFTSASSFQQHLIAEAFFGTIEALNAFSFVTTAVVCDGASENLALIKSTIGHKGPFGYIKDENGKIDVSVNPTFDNPFFNGGKIHWIVCPSHQLKNTIQALFSSREAGPKQFIRNGSKFGWNDIQAVKRRDERKAQRSQLRYEPKLLTSYIVRDSWTRLNVVPSKIMQQEGVLSELYSFMNGTEGSDPKRKSARLTYNFLRATNQIFENGILSHRKVSSSNSEVLHSIRTGFKYFEEWFNEVLEEDSGYAFNDPKQTKFLSWQAWDLMRIMVYGYINLSNDFLTPNPDYFLAPLRTNGSAVESLFSQMKYASGSKLSSINYSTARRAVLTRKNIHGKKTNNKNIRDTYLYLREGI